MTDEQKQQFLDKLNSGETHARLSAIVMLRKSVISSISAHQLEAKLGNETSQPKIEKLERQKQAANELILEILLEFPAAQADALLSNLMTDNTL